MRKQVTAVFPQAILILYLTLSLVVAADIQTAKGQNTITVEGVWEVISVSSDTDRYLIGTRVTISRQGDGYAVNSVPPDGNPTIYKGNERRIVRTSLELLIGPDSRTEGNRRPDFVIRKFAGMEVPINHSYTLSADGNFLTRENDGKSITWQINNNTGEVSNIQYKIVPFYFKRTLKRISGLVKVENRNDRAYQADCGPVDPNRTTPFPPDHEFCPGNLVCMTNFCGGGMGCPYVCCPKGLPYLNHCDCKCYENSNFDCHSYSYCKEKLIR